MAARTTRLNAVPVGCRQGEGGWRQGLGQAMDDEPTPVNVISLRTAGFSDDEMAEFVPKGGSNAELD
jgi:hypothetical protein